MWTNGLMAPEAYTLKAALDGWIRQESKEEIRKRAASAYAKYQKCSDAAALRLFSSDWRAAFQGEISDPERVSLRMHSVSWRELTQSRRTPYNFYTTSAGVAQW